VIGKLLLLAASASAVTPGRLTDSMSLQCNWYNNADKSDERGTRKGLQTLIIGYVNGQLDAAVQACDRHVKLESGFCKRLMAKQIDMIALGSPEVAKATDRLCGRNPNWTMRDVAQRILSDQGVIDAK
jgi:hypothetical protein